MVDSLDHHSYKDESDGEEDSGNDNENVCGCALIQGILIVNCSEYRR